MPEKQPLVVIIGGPNGAGKTTISREVLANTLGITEFVNADTIAAGLSGFNPEGAAFAAGRVMLNRMRELAATRTNFSFESTLASRSFAPWLSELKAGGWNVVLVYVWVRTSTLALQRVKRRVESGGHGIPPPVVRRRYARSARNLFDLYMPLADSWQVYDNSAVAARIIAARNSPTDPIDILDRRTFDRLRRTAHGTPKDRIKAIRRRPEGLS